MPKTTTPRSFTACWTCRRRNVRCDTAAPSCRRCNRAGIVCEGYELRLAWVDSETGSYIPRQRRAYPCNLTWKGFPGWTLEEIDHLLNDCSQSTCQCELHQGPNPFSTFAQYDQAAIPPPDDVESCTSTTFSEPQSSARQSRRVSDSVPPDPPDMLGTRVEVEFEINSDAIRLEPSPPHDNHLAESGDNADVDYSTTTSHEVVQRRHSNSLNSRACGHSAIGEMLLVLPRSLSQMPSKSCEENRLFSHYISCISGMMMPIDSGDNPWKTTYPSIAMSNTSSKSARCLYHAILAQSALHMANLKGGKHGEFENAMATRYHGMALCELRQSLFSPTENYSSVLAALLTVTIGHHVFRSKSPGWRTHFHGATEFILQYVAKRPWRLSRDAWVITQNFILSNILAQTANKCTTASNAHITKVYEVFCDVTSEPRFGYTIGGSSRMLKSIYQIRLLEEQVSMAGSAEFAESLNDDVLEQVSEIIKQLLVPLNEEIEAHSGIPYTDGMKTMPNMETRVGLHLRLFNAAVMIHLFRTVLRVPPCSIVDHVSRVLTDAVSLMHMTNGAVSIWPVFIAATEAYTPKLQALASHFFRVLETYGAGNRQDVHRVTRQVWADRERLAAERQCDPGEVVIDWRDTMNELDVDLLLI